MLISCVVCSVCQPFFLRTHVGQASLSRQRMEFQSHDRIISTELECCLTRNAGPHSAVCTFVAVAEGDDRAACRGAPPTLTFLLYTYVTPYPAPLFLDDMSCCAPAKRDHEWAGKLRALFSTAKCFSPALLTLGWLNATRGMHHS